ncbi:MAG: hypothetical protein IMX00_02705 [Limnochordales bacterium]|nr:hypothetical protein [Limnochordales bacterium]
MPPEHPAIYLLRLLIAGAGLVILAGLLYLSYARLLRWGNTRERELLGKRSIPHYELRHIGYLAQALREGQAAFCSPRLVAGAGFAAGFSLVLIPPVLHLLYTIAITVFNLSFMTGAPIDPRLPPSMYPWPIFRDNIIAICRYLPYLLLIGIIYGILATAFALSRQRLTRAQIQWQFLGIDIPGSWLVGIPLGALFYFLAGALSHERALGWILTQHVFWAVASYAISLYLHRMEDILLYWFTRFDWETRTANAVRYILLDRFSQPAPQMVQPRAPDGYLLVDAELLPQDAPIFIGLAAQLPGVEKVELRNAGQVAGDTNRDNRAYSLLREAAALRDERRHTLSAGGSQTAVLGEGSGSKKRLLFPREGDTRASESQNAPSGRRLVTLQFVLFVAGALLLGIYFYGPAAVRYFWPERVFGPLPSPELPAGLELTAELSLSSLPDGASPSTLTVTPSGSLAVLASDGKLWIWPGAGQALSQTAGKTTTTVKPAFHLLPLLPGERVTHVAPAPDDRLLAAIRNDSQPEDQIPALMWVDPDTQKRSQLPPLSLAPFPAPEKNEIRLVQLAVDHHGRPYAAVAIGNKDSASFFVAALFGNRWQTVFSGPVLLALIPSYQEGLPLIALTASVPALYRIGYGDQAPLPLRGHALPPDLKWSGGAMTAEQYLTLVGPGDTLVQIAPDGYPIAYLKVGEPEHPAVSSPTDSSPSSYQVVAWSDSDAGKEWVGLFSEGRLRVYQPDSVGRLVRLAYRLEASNQRTEATAIWRNVLRVAPTLPQAHVAVGKAYFERQDWQNAAKEFYLAGEKDWLERALANLDSQTRRDQLLPLLLVGATLVLLSAITSFLDSGKGARGVSVQL